MDHGRADALGGLRLSAFATALVESAMDAIIVIDVAGRVLAWNAAAAAMFGRAAAEVAGCDLAELIIPPQLRAAHRDALARVVSSGSSTTIGRRIEVTGQRADGTPFPVELTITRVVLQDRVLFTGYLRDITERRQMLTDLQDSRRRLISVSDEARHRVERDLHDGAQQQLVSVAMTLTAARSRLPGHPDAAEQLLEQASQRLTDGIEQLRSLARGIHPSSLAEHGLGAALNELVRHSVVGVDLDVQPHRRLSAAVESTVYFVVAEGLTNAARYGATTSAVTVRLVEVEAASFEPPDTAVEAVVRDDGPGGAVSRPGSGLAGLVDRVSAVGGHLDIDSPACGGTTLTARIVLPADTAEQAPDRAGAMS